MSIEPERTAQRRGERGGYRRERQAHLLAGEPKQPERALEGRRICLGEEELHEGMQTRSELMCLHSLTCVEKTADLDHLAGQEVRKDGDNPAPSEGKRRQERCIVPRIQLHPIPDTRRDLGEFPDGVPRLLDGADVRMRRQLCEMTDGEIYARAGGDVIDDDRQLRSIRHRVEMTGNPVVRPFVVIRRHNEQGIRPVRSGETGIGNGARRRRRADTHDIGAASVDQLSRPRDELQPLPVRKSCCLPRRPAYANGGDSASDLPLDQSRERFPIDSPLAEGGRQRRADAAKKRRFGCLLHVSHLAI